VPSVSAFGFVRRVSAWAVVLAFVAVSSSSLRIPAARGRFVEVLEAAGGPILSLPMNEGTGTTTADASGNGSNGVLQNGPTWTTGKFGTGVKFDGSNDTVYVSSPTALNTVKTGVTVSAWVYRNATQSGDVSVVSREVGTTYYEHYYLGFKDGKYQWFVNTTSGYSNMGLGGTAPVGQWVHMVGTYDGSTVRFYVNGVQQYSTPQSGTFPTDTTGLTIGASHNDASHVAGEAFNGSIDEVTLYARALSAQEVSQLYQATSSGTGTPPAGGGSSTVPTAVAFTPSADHDILVQYYSLDLHRSTDAMTATPVSHVDLGKPAVVNGAIQVDITSAVSLLPAGSYYAVVTAAGLGGVSAGSQSSAFAK